VPLWLRGSVLLLSLLGSPAWAVRTVHVDQALVLRLEANQPTSVVYPELLVDTTSGYADATMEVKAKGPNVYVIPKQVPETFAGRFFATGESGEVYVIHFKMGSPSDDKVYVIHPPATTSPKAVPLDPPAFLQYLYAGQPIPGEQPGDLAAPALTDGRLTLLEMQSVRVQGWYGALVRVRNASLQPLVLDMRAGFLGEVPATSVLLSALAWPPRVQPLLLTVKQELLPPGVETTIYVVLERAP
jgi:hypothetical protein